jgi:predicted esterase
MRRQPSVAIVFVLSLASVSSADVCAFLPPASRLRARRHLLSMAAASSSSSSSSSSKLKVMALHGYMQTGQVFREKSGSFRKSLKAVIGDVVFLEGPYEAEEAGGKSWWRWTDGGDRPSKSVQYSCVEETIALLRKELSEHKPRAFLGFSQGATATALLLASLARDGEEQGQHAPRFAVLVGGFLPRDERVAAMLAEARPQTPTLFIAGEGDQLVPPDRTRALLECFSGPTELLLHPGGHHVPALKADAKETVLAFIERHK